MGTILPTDIDATFPDRDPGDAEHQRHHDAIHAYTNEHDTATDPHGDRAYADGQFSPLGHTHSRIAAQALNSAGATTIPGSLALGLSVTQVTAASGPWPGNGTGVVVTRNFGSAGETSQDFTDTSATPRLFVRRWQPASTAWSTWSEK